MVIINNYIWNLKQINLFLKEPKINFRTENYNLWKFKFFKLNNRMEMREELVSLKNR